MGLTHGCCSPYTHVHPLHCLVSSCKPRCNVEASDQNPEQPFGHARTSKLEAAPPQGCRPLLSRHANSFCFYSPCQTTCRPGPILIVAFHKADHVCRFCQAALTLILALHDLGQLGLVGPDVLDPGLDGALVAHPDVLRHLLSTEQATGAAASFFNIWVPSNGSCLDGEPLLQGVAALAQSSSPAKASIVGSTVLRLWVLDLAHKGETRSHTHLSCHCHSPALAVRKSLQLQSFRRFTIGGRWMHGLTDCRGCGEQHQ